MNQERICIDYALRQRHGAVLLFDTHIQCRCNVQMLGDRVEEPYEALKFQNRFGGSARPAAAPEAGTGASEADEGPPRFKTLVPGKTRVPKRVPPAEVLTNGHRCVLVSTGVQDLSVCRDTATLDSALQVMSRRNEAHYKLTCFHAHYDEGGSACSTGLAE